MLINAHPRIVFALPRMLEILLRSRVGSLQIEPCKSPEMIAGSDEGSDTDSFAKDEDQTEENWAPWVQSACAKASVLALE